MKFPKFNPTKVALAGAALIAVPRTQTVRAAERTPNVIIIYTDDQGYADLGSFGAQGFKTPNIDQMAREGRRFTDFHVAQPICSASRASLLTGCYPNRIGLSGALSPHSKIGIDQNETTLAQLFKKQSYATGMVGKWHLGDAPQFLPTKRGFDQYYGIPYSHDMWPRHPETPSAYPPLPLMENTTVINPDLQPADLEQLTTNYTKRAVDFIDQNREKPFFLYLAHNLPHVPLFVSEKFKGKSKKGLYGDVIEEIDWSVGEVNKTLKRNRLDENTLVIFASDNGPWLSYGEHAGSAYPFREGKGTSWEGGTRVPCVMRWPGHIPANTVCDEMLMTIDILPTLAKLIAAPLPEHQIDGLNVWSLISGAQNARNPHDAYYFYYANNQLQAVTSGEGRWKLVMPHAYRTLNGRTGRNDGMPINYEQAQVEKAELYDLHADRSETSDVAAHHPEIVARLLAYAETARADLGDSLTKRTGSSRREPGRVPPSPQIPGKALTITCKVTRHAGDGVILSQGGRANVYALHLRDGKVVFSVRQKGKLYIAQSPNMAPAQFSLRAQLQRMAR